MVCGIHATKVIGHPRSVQYRWRRQKANSHQYQLSVFTPAALKRRSKMTYDRVDPQLLLLGKRRGFFAANQAKTDRLPANYDGREKDGIEVGAGQKGPRQILPGVQLERLL